METENLLINGVEERTGRSSGNTFWAIKTDKGEYTCHEPLVFDKLAKNQGNICKLETLRTEKYNNIKSFVEVVEVGKVETSQPVQKNAGGNGNNGGASVSQLTSYAKDIFVSGKARTMEEATELVIKAYTDIANGI